MNTKYVIKWTSKINGRAGRGTREFERDKGEELVAELNLDYPDIEHELIIAPPPAIQPQETEGEAAETENREDFARIGT